MNSRALWKCLLCCCVLLAADALADEAVGPESPDTGGSPDVRLAFGVRAGVAVHLNKLAGVGDGAGKTLLNGTSAITPLLLDVGVLKDSRWYVGAYFQDALGLSTLLCARTARSCVVTDMRLGLTASYHLPWQGGWSPWLGVGAGYERFGEMDELTNAKTLEVNAQGGADFQLSRSLWMGPFGMLTVNKPVDSFVPTGLHSWLFGGLRLQVRLS
ncbi:MAG: hypothetical protein ACJ8AT_14990 [Hyalangium sp.]|uniref:hypothetical protein n=1 Tax=Hyalangium sp. TaxID=2028555 RepID=UPI00389A8728